MKKILQKMRIEKKYLLWLVAIVVVGGAFRLYHLGSNSFVADEFLDINSAYAYRMTHVWQAWDFNYGKVNTQDVFAPRDERAWMYKWQVAELLKLVAPTEQNARLVSVFWGLVSIVLLYAIGASWTKNRAVGLLSAALFAVSAIGIMFDRKLRMYAMFYPVYLTLSWLIYKCLEQYYDGKNALVKMLQKTTGCNVLYVLPALLVGLLGLHLQLLTVNIVAVLFVYVLVQAILTAKKEKKFSWNKYNIFSLLMFFGAIGAIKFLPNITGVFVSSIKFFINNEGYFAKILADYSNPIIAIVLFIAGVGYLYKIQKLKKEALWLASNILVPLLMAAFMWRRTQGIQYIFFAQSFLIIILACGIYAVAYFFAHNLKNYAKQSFAVAIALLLLVLPNFGYFFDDNNTYHRTDVGDYRKVLLYVKKNLAPGDVIITRNFRNYYLSGAHVPVIDFGGEAAQHQFSLQNLQDVMSRYPHGWIVLFDNDDQFISKDVRNYIEKNLTQVDNSNVRGEAAAYTWGK